MTDEEYAQHMAWLAIRQQNHERELKASGEWVDTSGPEYDDDLVTMYDDPLLLLLSDGDPF
jgi:hypothetical protein